MPHFQISHSALPEISKADIPFFKEFMNKEFSGYMVNDNYYYAHNEGDSQWFTKQFIEAKKGKGIYADFFKETTNS